MNSGEDDFQQMMLDYFSIEQRRHQDIMAQASDILAKIMAIGTSLDAMKTTFDKAMADVSETVPAGHAAVLDTLTPALDEIATKIVALGPEMAAKIKALPVPGATPPASQ
jgi:hypothetical protein